MNTPTAVFMVSAIVIVLISLYLTVAKCYRTGLTGSVGFFLVALGFGSMVFEYIGGVEFMVLPQVALGTAGMALFFAQHFVRTRRFRRKRENSLGSKAGKDFKFSSGN